MAWPNIVSATVIKRTEKKRVGESTRRRTHGTLSFAEKRWQPSRGGSVRNTAWIEHVYGTMRERLASRTRTGRHAAHRVHALETGMDVLGCTSHRCVAHHEVRSVRHDGFPWTPAMASGFTDPIWSVGEVLTFTVAPAPWVEPNRRGRPRFRPLPDPTVPRRPRGRPRTLT